MEGENPMEYAVFISLLFICARTRFIVLLFRENKRLFNKAELHLLAPFYCSGMSISVGVTLCTWY